MTEIGKWRAHLVVTAALIVTILLFTSCGPSVDEDAHNGVPGARSEKPLSPHVRNNEFPRPEPDVRVTDETSPWTEQQREKMVSVIKKARASGTGSELPVYHYRALSAKFLEATSGKYPQAEALSRYWREEKWDDLREYAEELASEDEDNFAALFLRTELARQEHRIDDFLELSDRQIDWLNEKSGREYSLIKGALLFEIDRHVSRILNMTKGGWISITNSKSKVGKFHAEKYFRAFEEFDLL